MRHDVRDGGGRREHPGLKTVSLRYSRRGMRPSSVQIVLVAPTHLLRVASGGGYFTRGTMGSHPLSRCNHKHHSQVKSDTFGLLQTNSLRRPTRVLLRKGDK